MIERFISGTEMTVGIFEERAVSPIKITTSHEFFDYSAKYQGNDARHDFSLGLNEDVIKLMKQTAERAHERLGCRDLSRVDFIVDQKNQSWLLEINTMPGFTPKSLLPEAAAHDGVPFAQLVDRLDPPAAARGSASIRQAV